ncbi:MAG: methylated-DNA--[protein]-cysteine S-methyltransferase, partial [Solirubrobacteraceae bacterium]
MSHDSDHTTPDSAARLEQALRESARRPAPEPPAIEDAAAAAGLLDVAYATLDSPLGELLLATTPAGLACITYLDVEGRDRDTILARLSVRLSPRILRSPGRLDEPRRELDEYFAGRRRAFELRLDLTGVTPFAQRVLRAAAAIPYGEVATYT